MLWVLKRTLSMRRFFLAQKHMLKSLVRKYLHFTLINFCFFNMCKSLVLNVSDGFPVGQDVFNQYLYNFVHTSGFGDGYKSYIEVRNNTGAVDVS